MNLNKVNYVGNPRNCAKRTPGKVLPKWRGFEYVPNLKEHFTNNAPYFVVCGDAGGELPYLAVIDLDVITIAKLNKEAKKKVDDIEKDKAKGRKKKRKYTYDDFDPEMKRRILQDDNLTPPEDVLNNFMKDFQLDDTYIVQTGSGWYHLYYFIDDAGTNLKNKVAKRFYDRVSIDLRPAGGMVFGEGTFWKNTEQAYILFRGSQDSITSIPGWKIAWAVGMIDFSVAGMNLANFISGIVDVHDIVPEKDKEFIVWREAMFFLKMLGYNKTFVENIFKNQPGYDPEICGDQIDSWWDKEDDPRRVVATNNITGKPMSKIGGKAYWKYGQIPWYIHLEDFWVDKYEGKIRYISDYNEWVAFTKNGYYERLDQLLISAKIDNWLDDNFVESTIGKKNLGIKRLKGKYFSLLKNYGHEKDLRCIINGILNIKTKELFPHDKKYMFLQRMDVKYKLKPDPTPYIDRIREAYPIQFERLERYIQAVLHHDMSNELMCFVYGPTSSGKGTVGGLIKKMFKGSLSFAKVHTLGNTYGMVPLLTKLMNYDPELNIGFLKVEDMTVMKHIVGRDGEISINKKFTSQFMYDFAVFFFINFGNQLPELASTDIKAWFRRVWLVYFFKTMEPDPIMKEQILFEVDDWFTYLVNKEYKPIKTEDTDLNAFMEANKSQWYKSAKPLIIICDRLFEYVKNDELAIHSDDIATWCSTELHKGGFWVPNRNTLKKRITNILGDMGIYTRRIENRMWYYNIRVKDIATEVKKIIQEKSESEQRRMG